mgnify:CR=1 FL=1
MRDYFCGWYLKCQNESQTIALIAAYHITGGKKSCSLQVITDDASWNVPYPYEEFEQTDTAVRIGPNHFDKNGFALNLHTPELTAVGKLSFGPLAPIRYDIMGPFKYVPFMECRHSVFSMRHTVNGTLQINGTAYEFIDRLKGIVL